MKPELRYRNFDLNQMFGQRMSYEIHKKKLEQLSSRKSYYINSDRMNQLQVLKVRKHNSFLKDIFNRNKDINKSNIKIFEKLSSTQENVPSFICKIKQSNDMTPFRKKILQKTQLQNSRMFDKLRSLQNSSIIYRTASINSKRIAEQYSNTIQIKKRISRYECNPISNKILPKSEKVLNFSLQRSMKSNQSIKNSTLYNQKGIKLLKIDEKKLQSQSINDPKPLSIVDSKKTHYFNKRQIENKDKFQNRSYFNRRKFTQFNSQRPFSQNINQNMENKNHFNNEDQNTKLGFFTTEVSKTTYNKPMSNLKLPKQIKQI